MNWGKGLVIAGASFMAFILGLSFYLMSQKPELATENYYEKDLVYQQEMEAKQNARDLATPLEFVYKRDDQTAILQFVANQPISGKIHFVRPSDARQDFILDLKPDLNGRQVIAMNHLSQGLWRVQAKWQMATKLYQSPEWEVVK